MNEIELEYQALICEREAMIAENWYRQYTGQSQAYSEDNFMILARKFRELKDKLNAK